MLGAILRPTAGWAVVAGYDVVEHPREVRRRVGLLTEQPDATRQRLLEQCRQHIFRALPLQVVEEKFGHYSFPSSLVTGLMPRI